jgi:outer membrane protein assembly factor BamB
MYMVEDSGEAHCFELKTGKEVWQQPKRLGATKNWGSMVATGDGRHYIMGWDGTTHILTASPKFEELATNALKENTNASIAVSNGELFIRTNKHLWCIAEKK